MSPNCFQAPSYRRPPISFLLVLVLLLTGCGGGGETSSGVGNTSAPALYRVTGSGPAGSGTVARDMDDTGRVVGTAGDNATVGTDGFLWEDGNLSEFPGRTIYALNRHQELVGDSAGVAYLWRGAETIPLAYGKAWDISETGLVVGEGLTGEGRLHAFLWEDGNTFDLGTLGGGWSVAYGVNSAGLTVGWSERADGSVRGFRWDGAAMEALGTLGGDWSMAYAVNEHGEVAGYAATADGTDHAFFAGTDGALLDLGTLGGHSIAFDLDNAGRVVGESGTRQGATHAFLWQDGSMVDLNDVIPTDSDWTLVRATAINAAGQIVGEGMYRGEKRPFLLTPIEK